MKVLGLDPGMIRLGYSECYIAENGDPKLGLAGVITNTRGSETFNEYLNDGIRNIVDKFAYILSLTSPDIIVAELVPVGRLGSRSELVVAGITSCKVLAYQGGLPWKDVGANSYKKALTGNGNASKGQIKRKVQELFPNLKELDTQERARQKEAGEKRTGFPIDLWDAVAVSYWGIINAAS